MRNKSPPKSKPEPVASFDLEVARATSLTDNMSTESSKDRPVDVSGPNDPLDENNSFVISPKRGVSFSKDTMGPKPKPTGVGSLCLATRSGKRVVCHFVHIFIVLGACMRMRFWPHLTHTQTCL